MKTRIIIGAQAAYCCIKTEAVSLDVRLLAGRSAPVSLYQSAMDLREDAERLLKRAHLIEDAAAQLEQEAHRTGANHAQTI